MSCIEKMTIQGVRSFGSEDADRQCIEFFAPLTLILGPNGTGKTTIIECLKYITTGDLPPGGKTNAAFIHDPKLAGETTVNAQIRLLFRDVQSQRCTATRSLTATQKAKKIEMKTVEGLITRKDRAGNLQSVSSKCAEMDREMVSLLGVAKPVLDSVIFCHQEEANWPLSEGKALKTRFDDIFASTRYVKALDVIKKYRADQKNEITLFQNDIKYLKHNKDIQAEKQAELEEQEAKYVASKEAVAKIKERMQPIVDKLDHLKMKGQEIYKFQTKIEKMKTECAQIEKSRKELQKNVKREFQGSTTELMEKLRDFGGQVEDQEDALRTYETKLDRLTIDLDDLSEEKAVLLVEQGVLQQDAQRHEQNIRKRDDLIEKLADEYTVPGFQAPISDRQLTQFVQVMQKHERDMEDEIRACRAEYEEKEGAVQREVDDLRNTRTKLETELNMKLDTLDKNRQEIREIKQKLGRVDASAEKLTDIDRDLKKTVRELDETEKAVNLDALKTEVISLQECKRKRDTDLKTLDAELNRLSLESTARTQLDLYKKDRTSKTDTVRKLKAKTEDSMKHIVGHMPTESLRRELDKSSSKLSHTVRKTTEQIQRLRNDHTQISTQCKMQREQLGEKEDELRGYEVRLNNVSGSQNFDEGLNKLQADMRKAQEDKGNLNGINYLYRSYEGKLGGQDPPCPLCHRPFDNPAEVEELTRDIQEKLNMVPGKLERVNRKIDTNRVKVEEMLQLKPVRSAMTELQQESIPTLKQKIKALTEQMDKLETDKINEEEVLETYIADEQTAQMIQTDVAMIDKIQTELKDLDKKIAQQASKLSGGDSGRSMQDVQTEREEIQDELETVNRNLDRKRQKISEQSERLQQLKETHNELNAEKLEVERELQQTTQLEEKKVNLESSSATLDREVRDSRKEMTPLQASIAEKEKKKQKISKDKERVYEEGMAGVNVKKDQHQRVKSHNTEIKNYLSKGNDKKLEDNTSSMEMAERRASKLSRDRDTVGSKINDIKEELAEQKIRERELRDNVSMREKQKEIEDLVKDIDDHKAQLGGLDVSNLNQQVREMEAQQEKFSKEKHQAEGRQGGLEDTMRILKKDLRSDMYKDAEVKYREKMIALRTTELAYQDLEKYHKALDKAIMTYHSTKMKEINKIIRELWRNTYKGNDIETIEIRSEAEESSGAMKTRQVYNYRVVMLRGDTALDMRNRCSAGQKVLASLIIRLALAETFCLNCGILALDEPTTNLDRENIESLAFALVEIIKGRSRQRNFQLVVITHDEDFVELLGRSDYVEEFFKVRKNEYGCSQLVKAKVQDLHTR